MMSLPLRALMLVTSAARELQFAVADEWMTSTGFTPPHPRATVPGLSPGFPAGDGADGDDGSEIDDDADADEEGDDRNA